MRYANRNTLPTDFHHETAQGNVPFRRMYNCWGTNTLTTAGTAYAVWSGGATAPVFQLSPAALAVVSTNAQDNSLTGTGARTIRITGTNVNGVNTVEYVSLNGTTPVATTGIFFCVSDATVVTCGIGEVNAGTISITHSVSTNLLSRVAIGQCRSNGAVFQPPMEAPYGVKSLNVTSYLAGNTVPLTTVRIIGVTYGYQSALSKCRTVYFEAAINNSFRWEFHGGMPIPKNTLIWVEAIGAANSAICSAHLQVITNVTLE